MTPCCAIVRCAGLCRLLLLPAQTAVQPTYPSETIRLAVPFPPGGSVDPIARMIGQKLTEAWGQQLIVDNRPGSSGTIGPALLAEAPPVGHTLTHLRAS